MKTGVTGSPRRTPALRSTPDSQDISSSSPSNGKGSNAQSESRQDFPPLSVRSVNARNASSNRQNGARFKPTKSQLTEEPEPTFLPDFSDDDADGDENAFAQVQENFADSLVHEEYPTATAEFSDSEEPEQNGQEPSPSPVETAPRTQPALNPSSTKKITSTKASKSSNQEKPQTKPPGRRGRPRKSDQHDTEEDPNPRPNKRQKNPAQSPLPEREPLEPELDRVVNDYASRTGPLKGRSLYILKRENPSGNSATHTRSGRVSVRPLAYWRNERCVFGDGEVAEGHRYPLSTIKEVIRTEEQEEPHKRKKGKRAASHKSKSKKRKDDSSDEEDEEVDLWEKEGGVLHGYTLKWDSKTQASSKEEEVLGRNTPHISGSFIKCVFLQILRMLLLGSRPGRFGVQASDSQSCSALLSSDLEWWNCLRTGSRSPKTRRKCTWYSTSVMDVCRWISQVSSLVLARVVSFKYLGVSPVFFGGLHQPNQAFAGNYYSFANAHQKEARLFFTQGCVPDETEDEVENETQGETDHDNDRSALSRDASGESEPEPEPEPIPQKKARGRPKGKQKKAGK